MGSDGTEPIGVIRRGLEPVSGLEHIGLAKDVLIPILAKLIKTFLRASILAIVILRFALPNEASASFLAAFV